MLSKKTKILLVDDREDNLESMEAILARDGYQFVRANSGWEALKILLDDADFALILMDVRMPRLNGFETAALIDEREKTRHIPIIFITANSYGEDNLYNGHHGGAVDYLSKPISPEMLRTRVSVFIDLYRKNCLLLEQEEKLLAINKSLELEIDARKALEERAQQLHHRLLTSMGFSRISP